MDHTRLLERFELLYSCHVDNRRLLKGVPLTSILHGNKTIWRRSGKYKFAAIEKYINDNGVRESDSGAKFSVIKASFGSNRDLSSQIDTS